MFQCYLKTLSPLCRLSPSPSSTLWIMQETWNLLVMGFRLQSLKSSRSPPGWVLSHSENPSKLCELAWVFVTIATTAKATTTATTMTTPRPKPAVRQQVIAWSSLSASSLPPLFRIRPWYITCLPRQWRRRFNRGKLLIQVDGNTFQIWKQRDCLKKNKAFFDIVCIVRICEAHSQAIDFYRYQREFTRSQVRMDQAAYREETALFGYSELRTRGRLRCIARIAQNVSPPELTTPFSCFSALFTLFSKHLSWYLGGEPALNAWDPVPGHAESLLRHPVTQSNADFSRHLRRGQPRDLGLTNRNAGLQSINV